MAIGPNNPNDPAIRYRLIMRRAIRLQFATLIAGFALMPLHALHAQQAPPKPKRIDVEITAKGFTPSSITVEPGVPLELVFTRRTDQTCATEVVVPSLKLKKPLPLNEPVPIAITPGKDDVAFACGMNMLKGTLVVKSGG